MRINEGTLISEIKLAENGDVPNKVQVLRVGKFKHPQYGDFEITPKVLAEMKSNFDKKVRGIDTAFDYFHASDKEASAWVEKLDLSSDGQQLWATVDWTPKAKKMLSERELRYFSPDFSFKWTDPESGVDHANVLFGGGLTNRPFVKEMEPIVAHEKGAQMSTELETLKAQVLKLNEEKGALEKKMADMVPAADADKGEDGAEVESLKKVVADLQALIAKLQGENAAMLAEKQKADEAVKMAEKKAEFTKLLSEGKACAAQEGAFLKGDMSEFIKLAEPVNLNGKGTSANVELSEEDKTLKLAEEKRKADPKLDYASSISLARKELKK